MTENKNLSQVAVTTSEDRGGMTVQISSSMLSQMYASFDIAKEIIEISASKGWKKEQLLLALKIIQSLE